MSDTITLPAPLVEQTPEFPIKWEREHHAFRRLLPQLITTHRNQYVAIHNREVVDCGDGRLTLALRVRERVGNVDIHVGLEPPDPEPASRSGVRHDARPKH